MLDKLQIQLNGRGPEDDSGADSHWEDTWVHDWRTPFIPELYPDRGATSEIPTPAPEPPQKGNALAG
jgi:hypothetical protein